METLRKIRGRLQRMWSGHRLSPLAREIKSRQLTFLSIDKLISLEKQIRRVEKADIPGDFVEFGVASGGTAILLSSVMENRRFHGFDVFGFPPAPSERDEADSHIRYKIVREGNARGMGEHTYYGYVDDLLKKVTDNFEKFGLKVDQDRISLHRGLFEDTVSFGAGDRVALAHIDCDWYDPVKFCIENVSRIMPGGGVIIVDDYNDFVGCKNAVHDTMSSDSSLKIEQTEPHAVLRKI